MKKLMKFVLAGLLLAMMSVPAMALDDPCFPDGYRTQTQGGWGADCHGGNNGCLRDNNWNAAFPSPQGLVIGGTYTITFTSSHAVAVFLATGGTPDVLAQDYVNPVGDTDAGVFAGQVTALAISLRFSEIGVPDFGPLGSLYYLSPSSLSGEPFSGMTVQQLFILANEVMGGNLGALPSGTTVPDLSDVITDINENFDNGTDNNGNLVEEGCGHDQELPVELLGFGAVAGSDEITLRWNTASESNINYYQIDRQNASEWSLLAQVNGQGDDPAGHSYSYVDRSVVQGISYNYRLTSYDFNGTSVVYNQIASASVTGSAANATEYELYQNYPNPFNPTTTISFSLPEAADIRLTVFDVLGRELVVLANGRADAGFHSVEFNAASLSAGTYFYQLTAGDFSMVRKLMLVK
jgi:hypothetical protein